VLARVGRLAGVLAPLVKGALVVLHLLLEGLACGGVLLDAGVLAALELVGAVAAVWYGGNVRGLVVL